MMKHLSVALLMGLGTLVLSGCGFQPVYAPSISAESGPVEIDQIDGRAGHELRKALLQETANGLPGAPQGARLTVSLRERIINTAFDSDGATTRAIIRLRADYVIDLGDNALSGREIAEVPTNIPDAIFQDITNQDEARISAAQQLARQITDRLILDLAPAP